MQASDPSCGLPQPLGPPGAPSAVVCHMRGLQLECRKQSRAEEQDIEMLLRGLTVCVLEDPLG